MVRFCSDLRFFEKNRNLWRNQLQIRSQMRLVWTSLYASVALTESLKKIRNLNKYTQYTSKSTIKCHNISAIHVGSAK